LKLGAASSGAAEAGPFLPPAILHHDQQACWKFFGRGVPVHDHGHQPRLLKETDANEKATQKITPHG
jgi:hypothetical protein